MTAEIRKFIDPDTMAEPKEIVRARMDGYERGKAVGYRAGLASGILFTALFFIGVYTLGKVIG